MNTSPKRLTYIALFLTITCLLSLLQPTEALRRLCTGAQPANCPTDFQNVCAFFPGAQCGYTPCAKLSLNACTACQGSNLSFYLDTPCNASIIYCDAAFRPVDCPTDEGPVCAFTQLNCADASCQQTILNDCTACMDPTILYFTRGACAV